MTFISAVVIAVRSYKFPEPKRRTEHLFWISIRGGWNSGYCDSSVLLQNLKDGLNNYFGSQLGGKNSGYCDSSVPLQIPRT